jgi:hypothetical protein
MNSELQTKQKEEIQLSDQEIFDILNRANLQYDSYIELTSIKGLIDSEDDDDIIEHDVSYPLDVSLK